MITRSFVLAQVCLVAAALAAPPLSTIQDTLYKADGSRFNGTLTISWETFEGPSGAAIVKQSTTVRVVDGFLKVQLVPTAGSSPAAVYKVVYNSDGRMQFQEAWNVPSSGAPLRVRDVRVVAPTGGGSLPETGGGPFQQSDVVGLVAALAARPTKGPGFAAGRVALVNDDGLLESVTGSAEDCVRVDGSSGPCGSGTSMTFVEGETPNGIVDGSNRTFEVISVPEPAASLAVYRNGLRQKSGLDYGASGRVLTFVPAAVPQPGDTLLVSYQVGGSETGAPATYPAAQVVCSGVGATVNGTATAPLSYCTIPAAALLPGDRLEVRFDLQHQGTAGGFGFDVVWESSTVLSRTAAVGDLMATGRVDVSVSGTGVQVSSQSWGTVMPLIAAVGVATDNLTNGITLRFQGRVNVAGDTLSLRNYTVTRLP